MSIKPIPSKNGKTRFKAQVWYGGQYFKSETFDHKHLAEQWYLRTLQAAIAGALATPKARKADKAQEAMAAAARSVTEAALLQNLPEIAQRFVQDQASWRSGKLGKTRNQEIQRVARYAQEILVDVAIKDFHGSGGVALIKKLTPELYWVRRSRTGKGRGASSKPSSRCKPLSDQSVRLLLTALFKLLRYARRCLPEDVAFAVPDMDSEKEFGWALPPAHCKPRKRISEDRELAAILHAAGPDSALGVLIQILDETGCRLGEVGNACGSQLTFFHDEKGRLLGGSLELLTHKTFHKTLEKRDVPLSAVAAELLQDRKKLHGNGPLFPTFHGSDDVCRQFAAACEAAGVLNLVTKDLRRGFLNRNKYMVSELDMRKVFGDSPELDRDEPDEQTKAVKAAMGHKRLSTTKGYVVPHLEKLAVRFTATSRHTAVMEQVRQLQAAEPGNHSQTPRRRRPVRTGGEIEWTAPSAEVTALAQALGIALDAAAY
jgi:integrase